MSPRAGEDDILVCDFTSNAMRHRLAHGGGIKQALPRAVGLKSNLDLHVIDATAGLGRDAFLLASLGATVTLIERSEKMHGLLETAIAAALESDAQIAEAASRMRLLKGDSISLLPELSADVVYIDPMHPPRKNSALVKKEMRLIRDIVGTDPDAEKLIATALDVAEKRVVVKWPRKADALQSIRPYSHQIVGKTTRYDVWMQP